MYPLGCVILSTAKNLSERPFTSFRMTILRCEPCTSELSDRCFVFTPLTSPTLDVGVLPPSDPPALVFRLRLGNIATMSGTGGANV
jgi:hypothetical protein